MSVNSQRLLPANDWDEPTIVKIETRRFAPSEICKIYRLPLRRRAKTKKNKKGKRK